MAAARKWPRFRSSVRGVSGGGWGRSGRVRGERGRKWVGLRR